MKSKAQVWITIIGSIASILGLVFIPMQLGWINSPDPDLVAEIEYGLFEYPPGLVDSLPSGVSQSFSHIRGYWSITLRNEGEKLAKSVKLWLENLVYVRIYRDNEELVSNESLWPIEIGDLHPPEEIKITAWSSSAPALYVLLHERTSDEIRLTHESGVGTVLIRAPIAPVWHKVEAIWPIFIFVLPITGYGLYGLFGWIKKELAM